MDRRRFLGLTAAMGGAIMTQGLAACGGDDDGGEAASAGGANKVASDWAGIEAAAEKEKAVTFYTLSTGVADAMTEGFTKAYPWAEVKAFVGNPANLAAKVVTEHRGNATGADVIQLPPSFRSSLEPEGIVASVTNLPSEQKLPSELLDSSGKGHPCYLLPLVLAHNTKLVPETPTDLFELADPKWKGKIAFDRPANIALSAYVLASRRGDWGDDKWRQWLDGLKANDVLITADGKSALQAVISGQRGIAIDHWGDVTTNAAKAPVEPGWYDGVVPFLQYLWVTEKAPNPNIARLFVDWQLSEVGQQAYAALNFNPVRAIDSDISIDKVIPSPFSLLPTAKMEDFFANTKEYADIFTELWPG